MPSSPPPFAATQSEILTDLMDSGFLRPDELDVVRWARNAKLQNFPKRFRGAGGAQGDDGRMLYRNATCLETLVPAPTPPMHRRPPLPPRPCMSLHPPG